MVETEKDQRATQEAAALGALIANLDPGGKALLVTSFHETVKLIQTYMVSGLGASFFFAVLVFSDVSDLTIQAPAVGSSLPVSANLALALALAIYWAAGLMCTLLVDRAKRISLVLQYAAPSLHIAAHSFPSVVLLRSYGPRCGLALCPAALVLVGGIALWGRSLLALWPAFGFVVLLLPFVVLVCQLWSPIGGNGTDLWRG
jgi:hypothetical protein